jgi:two-component system sensor histidine kinase/response regulator
LPFSRCLPSKEPALPFSSQIDRLNFAVALDRLGGDEQLLCEVAQLFLEECPELVTQVRTAVASGDADALQQAAHSLKGSVSNFGADAASEAALALELMGRNGELNQAQTGLAALEQALAHIQPALAELAAQAE